jgi:hypothetical protein
MGILRKLAELVVEFPEDKAPAGASQRDVLASIEEVRGQIEAETAQHRAELEGAVTTDSSESKGAAKPAGAGKASAGKPVKPTLPPRPTGVTSAISLPAVLGIQEVYNKAGLEAKAEGFDIYAVEKMLDDPEIAELPLETRAKSVRMALRSMGRELGDIISDAAKRDQALEIYEQVVGEAIADVSRQVVESNAQLQAEIDEFVRSKSALMEANQQALEQARQGLEEYRRTKAAEEERLFNTVAPFVAPGQNPVSLGQADDSNRKGKGS